MGTPPLYKGELFPSMKQISCFGQNLEKFWNIKYIIGNDFDKESIYIFQDNDNAKNYDSALIINYNNKKILKVFQVTKGEKKIKVLYDKYSFEILKNELSPNRYYVWIF